MKITREFAPADRYLYDFGLCSTAKGWAQIDTSQDASYFGTWANPTRLLIFNHCEGDTTLKEAGLCCTNPVRDSSRESSVVAGGHEQTHTPRLQDQELARL